MENNEQEPQANKNMWYALGVVVVLVVLLFIIGIGGQFGPRTNEFGVVPQRDVEITEALEALPDDLPFIDSSSVIGNFSSTRVDYRGADKTEYTISYLTSDSIKDTYNKYYSYILQSKHGFFVVGNNGVGDPDEVSPSVWDERNTVLLEATSLRDDSLIVSISAHEAGAEVRVTYLFEGGMSFSDNVVEANDN